MNTTNFMYIYILNLSHLYNIYNFIYTVYINIYYLNNLKSNLIIFNLALLILGLLRRIINNKIYFNLLINN